MFSHAASVALGASLAYLSPFMIQYLEPSLQYLLPTIKPAAEWSCSPNNYTTQLVSLDPLLIYIHNLVSPEEARRITHAGHAGLAPSPVTGYGGDTASQARTSWSAPLPGDDAAVQCVLARAEAFLGAALAPGRDDMGAAQMVHYAAGQRFDAHHDWFRQPRLLDGDGGRLRLYNRAATFFVVLAANCTGGETYFPLASPAAPQDRAAPAADGVWRAHEDGGLAFRPIPGNAVFWVNLLPNGTGDARTLHAGLPVGEGTKTAMNIWPRTFFGPEA